MRVIIGCGDKKLDRPAPAWRMYLGKYFTSHLRWVRSLGGVPSDLFILSAKYGLIPAQRVIEPYDARLGTKTQVITLQEIRQQVEQYDLNKETTLMALSGKYRTIMREAAPNACDLWDAVNLPDNRIGCRRGWLKDNMGRLPEPIQKRMQT